MTSGTSTDELPAVDALIWHQASGLSAATVAIIDAPELAGQQLTGSVRVWCDALADEAGVAADLLADEPSSALADADLVLLTLPKSLSALDEWCELICRHAAPGVRLVAGGRVKHMSRGMNEVLARHFGEVRASLGVRKARVLHASMPRRSGEEVALTYPRRSSQRITLADGERDVSLLCHGGVFAEGRIDAGTRLLLNSAEQWRPARDVVDLGCGSGILALAAKIVQSTATVLATDESYAACRSAEATLAENGVDVEVEWSDGLSSRPDTSADLILLNPPFHQGTAKESGPTMTMIADARRVLRRDGELWTVFNAHLPYLPLMREVVGSTQIAARNRNYVLTRSRRAQ
ncbi:MAG: class I SAM-dependent methyltransferase [Propionibacteriaceae bacterium]